MNVDWSLPTLIATDCEPDDVAALCLLLPRLKTDKLMIVVGQHYDVPAKCVFLRTLLPELVPHMEQPQFVVGQATRDAFPLGQQQQDDEDKVDVKLLANIAHHSTAAKLIATFVQSAPEQRCNVISLKPPRDLLRALSVGQPVRSHMPPTLFSHCTLYAYVSYNARSLLTEERTINGVFTHLTKAFQHMLTHFYSLYFERAVLFETYYALDRNSLQASDFPDCARPYRPALQKLVTAWNEHICEKKKRDLEKWAPDALPLLQKLGESDLLSRPEHPAHRALKIIHSITQNKDTNLLLADLGLAACMCFDLPALQLRPITVNFTDKALLDAKDREPEQGNSGGGAWLVQPEDKAQLRADMVRLVIPEICSV